MVVTENTAVADEPWDPYARGCPSRELLDRIGDKWSVLLLGELADQQPHRFAALRDRIEGISEKMLTQTLRFLEQDGLVSRRAFAQIPPRVEYQLTPLGLTLCDVLNSLRDWSTTHADEVMAARKRYTQAGRPGPAPEPGGWSSRGLDGSISRHGQGRQ